MSSNSFSYQIDQPKWSELTTAEEAQAFANEVGYPVCNTLISIKHRRGQINIFVDTGSGPTILRAIRFSNSDHSLLLIAQVLTC